MRCCPVFLYNIYKTEKITQENMVMFWGMCYNPSIVKKYKD